jgi:hypothetical protein
MNPPTPNIRMPHNERMSIVGVTHTPRLEGALAAARPGTNYFYPGRLPSTRSSSVRPVAYIVWSTAVYNLGYDTLSGAKARMSAGALAGARRYLSRVCNYSDRRVYPGLVRPARHR